LGEEANFGGEGERTEKGKEEAHLL
jgi:hypothetical protein